MMPSRAGEDVTQADLQEAIDPKRGLSAQEAADRLRQFGPIKAPDGARSDDTDSRRLHALTICHRRAKIQVSPKKSRADDLKIKYAITLASPRRSLLPRSFVPLFL